jgi:SOS response regulatory protein OraA/RecX
VVERVCDRCRELGYLDDAAFALSRARHRLYHGRYGPRRVWAELRTLRIADEQIQQALDILLAERDVVSLAGVALEKRFGDGKRAENDRRALQQQYDFLSRRGFNDEAIWQVLE